MIETQFTLYMTNRPGMLAKVTRALALADINIEGISVSESTDIALVQIVVNDAAATKKLLDKIRVPFTTQDVALVRLRHKPGSLASLVSRLARQGVHVNYVYATGCACKNDCHCYAVISSPNLRKVEAMSKSKR